MVNCDMNRLHMKSIEPEALSEPSHWKSASDSGSLSFQDLNLLNGNWFSPNNRTHLLLLYLAFPKGATESHLLSCSHIVEPLKADDTLERRFFEQQSPSNSQLSKSAGESEI